MNDKALLIFQGGGAKGIVHVGALLAIEQMNLDVRGVAGTSAGSIVAALVAAGFSGNDLVNLNTGKHLLDNRYGDMDCSRPRDLFGKWGWRKLRWAGALVYWGPTLILAAITAALFAVYAGDGWLGLALSIVCILLPVAFVIWLFVGITSTKHVRDFIDAVLRTRIEASTEAGVTFSDLAKAGRMPLKIVATNVSEERAEVFSLERTPDVPVADAVAASICLPVIFRPHRFVCTRGKGVTADRRERSYVDGGLISNLPVWTLDEERERHDSACGGELLTIAFGIEPKAPGDGSLRKPATLLQALISAVVTGSLELDMRKVPNAHHFMMACTLKLMDFHKPKHIYFDTVARAKGLAFSHPAGWACDISEKHRKRVPRDPEGNLTGYTVANRDLAFQHFCFGPGRLGHATPGFLCATRLDLCHRLSWPARRVPGRRMGVRNSQVRCLRGRTVAGTALAPSDPRVWAQATTVRRKALS
ncbi:patatin-like phospholipase family protein [Paraburkholderia sp. Clong3]|uniref:patatin-like phospholipase family protein n=1 Tax=Paraburkholderia sp. Clong3 TaxID=2991061 RepID=UPI003D1B1B84